MFACLLLRLVYFYFNCWIFIFLCWIKSNHSWNKAEAIRCMTWWLGGHCWSATNLRSHECSNTLLVWRSPPCTPCWHWKAICHRTFTTLWLSFWHAPCLHHKIRFWDKSLFDSVWQQSERQIAKKKCHLWGGHGRYRSCLTAGVVAQELALRLGNMLVVKVWSLAWTTDDQNKWCLGCIKLVQNHVIPAEWSSDHFISSCYLLIDIIINLTWFILLLYILLTQEKTTTFTCKESWMNVLAFCSCRHCLIPGRHTNWFSTIRKPRLTTPTMRGVASSGRASCGTFLTLTFQSLKSPGNFQTTQFLALDLILFLFWNY